MNTSYSPNPGHKHTSVSKKNSDNNLTSMFDVSIKNNPKRTQSSGNLVKKGSPTSKPSKNASKSGSKVKTSKFCKEEVESFEDLIQSMENGQIELIPYICTQKGSRALQNISEHSSPDKFEYLLEMLKSSFSYLMMDIYGNYLCQKLIQNCSSRQRVFILENICEQFCDIARNSSGTHSLQALIEIINLKEEEEIIKKSVEGKVVTLALDPNGTHVIQKILSCVD